MADDYIIGAGGASGSDGALARGGESVLEASCDSGGSAVVPVSGFSGTVSWKLHFQLLRDAWVKPDGTEFILPADGISAHSLCHC